MPPKIQLRSRVQGVPEREGAPIVASDCSCLLTGDADVYKPDGQLLCALRRQALPTALSDDVRPALLHAAQNYGTYNRGKYAGLPRGVRQGPNGSSRTSGTVDPVTLKKVRVESAVVGFLDPQGGRFPFCRMSSFTAEEVNHWAHLVPLTQAVGQLFSENIPNRFKAQMEIVNQTQPEYVITGTPFTTLTINHNIAGRIHQDAGDYKPGFGVISVHRKGFYGGGWLVFPEYQVGADLHDGDVIFFDPHEWHGVSEFTGMSEDYERLSVVYYYRAKMINCLPQAEELERARARGQITHDDVE